MEDHRERKRQHGTRFLIPAGILIGLGIGILLNNPFPFLLIGLGFGFLGSSFIRPQEPAPQDPVMSADPTRLHWSTAILGIFFILFGVVLVVAPNFSWTYSIAGALILLGLWFLVRASGQDF